MSKPSSRSRLTLANKKLSLENSLLAKKSALLETTISNSLSGLVSGLTGMDGGMNQAPITSFNPGLQANIYAPITLMWTNLMYMYKTHGLIQTAIDMPVVDALRGGLELSSNQLSPDEVSKLEDYLEEHAILERIGDAFIWARLFGGGALVINTEGDCSEPIGDEIRDGGQIELYDACRWELTCERRIPASRKYGFYGKQLDASRVITILGKRAPWLIRAQLSDWGMSEIERMVEDFNLFLRNRNVIYALLDEAKVDVYSLEGFQAQLASANGTALTQKRIQLVNQLKNFNNALILDKKDSYEQKQIQFGGLADILKENRRGISAALRMPISKLFGAIENGGLSASNDDLENYNGLVESEVRQPMKQVVRKVLKMLVLNLFGDDLDISFRFKPLRMQTPGEEETDKTSKLARLMNLYDHHLISSKEAGEILQKEELVSIPLAADQGLLDEHPGDPAASAGIASPSGDSAISIKEPEAAEPVEVAWKDGITNVKGGQQ